MPPAYVTAAEAGVILRCHERTIRRMIARGEIQAVFIAGRWLIAPEDLPGALPRRPPPPVRLRGPARGPVGQAVREIEAARRARATASAIDSSGRS